MIRVLEWAHRRRAGLARGEAVSRSSGLPPAWVDATRSFYDLLREPAQARSCTGTACHFERGGRPVTGAEVHCLGRCYEAPAASEQTPHPIPRASLVDPPVVLRHLIGSRADFDLDFDVPDGEAILAAVTQSGLRGRGGAAYPTGPKWRVARETPAPEGERYVVANGDEGDPGAYVDRLLLEEAPLAVLAGMVACGKAIGARHGIVFVRGEYPEARLRVEMAVKEARARGHLGPSFDVEVVGGAGSYVAGEETALLRAIEGLRAEPSPKPPYPAERGLHGLPTVVQNIETLSLIPWVVQNGRRADTKAICLSGAVAQTGVVEIRLGTPLIEVLERAGGGPLAGRPWKMALVGGPMGRVVPARDFGTPLSFDQLPGMGHGGTVVFDESVSAAALAEHLFRFASSESCGTCAPCRIGTAQLAQQRDRAGLERLCDTLEMGSLCGFGQGVPRPLRDLMCHFPDELFA